MNVLSISILATRHYTKTNVKATLVLKLNIDNWIGQLLPTEELNYFPLLMLLLCELFNSKRKGAKHLLGLAFDGLFIFSFCP